MIPLNCYSMTVGSCKCVFRVERERKKERKCEYLHDKGVYKGRWRRAPGALG